MKRRTWLLMGAGGAGALIVGWGVLPARSRLGAPALALPQKGQVALNGWIKFNADGTLVLAMPRSEMGQGVHTALPMIAAEELDVPLASVRIEQAGADAIFGNVAMFVASLPFHPLDTEAEVKPAKVRAGQWMVRKLARELGINATGGSSSVADAWDSLRLAAASARAALLEAAAVQWKVAAPELSVQNGVVRHAASGKSAPYATLLQAAAGVQVKDAIPKNAKDYKLIGTAAPRTDVAAKVDGSARFGLDVRLPGMVFAAVRLNPMLGGSPGAVQADAVLAQPGVLRLVRLPAFAGTSAGFAVVAQTTWHARQAAQALQAQWQQRPAGALDSASIERKLEQAVRHENGTRFTNDGSFEQARADSTTTLEAWYQAPYLAHATMEPMNCTAQVSADKVEVWAPTQVPQMARAIAAQVAGVALDAVTLHVTLLGGGFGRRLEVDHVAQAVRVAMDCAGRPVQLVWSREEDTQHDFYRPMHVARLQAAIDNQGKVSGLSIKSAGDAITPRWMERCVPALAGPVDTPDKTTAEGLFDLPYAIKNQRAEHVATRMGVPVGFWRSVGHSHNAFFAEGFIDEIAHELKADPLQLRRDLLGGPERQRYLAVLNLAAEKAGWGQTLPAGRQRGIALHESFGSIVAQVAEVSEQDGKPRVHRVVCAIDCGLVVNPGVVAQQMESSVVFALTAALYGKIDIRDGVVAQGNFPSYPMLLLRDTPQVQTHIVPSTRAPAGVGEPGVPPLAPAVAGAWFALTGKRLRRMPFAAAA